MTLLAEGCTTAVVEGTDFLTNTHFLRTAVPPLIQANHSAVRGGGGIVTRSSFGVRVQQYGEG